ncbi:hypothetical protein ScPMuIL_004040 [Solemya velum]
MEMAIQLENFYDCPEEGLTGLVLIDGSSEFIPLPWKTDVLEVNYSQTEVLCWFLSQHVPIDIQSFKENLISCESYGQQIEATIVELMSHLPGDQHAKVDFAVFVLTETMRALQQYKPDGTYSGDITFIKSADGYPTTLPPEVCTGKIDIHHVIFYIFRSVRGRSIFTMYYFKFSGLYREDRYSPCTILNFQVCTGKIDIHRVGGDNNTCIHDDGAVAISKILNPNKEQDAV